MERKDRMETIQQLVQKRLEVEKLPQQLKKGSPLITGLSQSAKTLYIASVYQTLDRPLVVIVPNLLAGQKLYTDLLSQLGEEQVYYYPAEELVAAQFSIASYESKAERIDTLDHLASNKKAVYILPVASLKQKIMHKKDWLSYVVTLEVGQMIDLEAMKFRLNASGYMREQLVTAPGQFSVRGGMIDIYPLNAEYPVRIELFDDEIDSIRSFDAETQLSIQNETTCTIGPANEWVWTERMYQELATVLEERLQKKLQTLANDASKERFVQRVTEQVETLRQSIPIDKIDLYKTYVDGYFSSITDYFSDDTVLIYDEMSRIEEVVQTLQAEETEVTMHFAEEGETLEAIPLSYAYHEVMSALKHPAIYLSLFKRTIPHVKLAEVVAYSCKPMQQFHGQMHVLSAELERFSRENSYVFIAVESEERKYQIETIFRDYSLDQYLTRGIPQQGKVQVIVHQFESGFEMPLQQIALITDHELFKTTKKIRTKTQKLSNAERIKSYSEINKGDYVVHVHHGIGKYYGVVTLEVGGNHKDYLDIRYRGEDKVYVPADQIDLIQKYVPSGEKEPKLHKLGGAEWQKTKKKVSTAVKDIADELIKLYAKREAEKGYSFSEDDDMQRSFEMSFPYEPTADQLQSIEEIKKDMERVRPMDRLLCGDVGYGKTEVAIRAAFKAINDGKQVAFLVPTTILAQQHYETMLERFSNFPVKVGLLNRFRTKKEQQATIKDLQAGVVDIVVGTHRLLSKDVQFQDLGLLIVDEEQRFGVTHKEKIKQMRTNVDVLTLTATPIPRTLHMSMVGVRDLSVIETPPANRFPVQTYVMEHHLGLVREAIEREMARGGQVFYLYNRVEDMMKRVDEIQQMVPHARIAHAHGQMNEAALETVILDFLEGQYDVLVTTTIIETGIDIPNVNTLIVHDADKMGLSQLYQLRGRVGRSNRVAYGYFLYAKDKVLTEVAEQRLQAIKEFTELGSGFKIAMRDLSIRGAGNLLGAQQHGFIDSVGFDLYSQMLQEAIEEKQNPEEEKEEPYETEIVLPIDAYLPDHYIADGFQKIQMYKRIKAIQSDEDYNELLDEMIDRFGDLPYQAELLLRVARIKALASSMLIESIKKKRSTIEIIISTAGSQQVDGAKIVSNSMEFGRAIGFSMENNKLHLTIDDKLTGKRNDFDVLEKMIEIIVESKKE